jgi:hypothetical protein
MKRLKRLKRNSAITVVLTIIFLLGSTTIAFGANENQIDIESSVGCYVTVSNLDNDGSVLLKDYANNEWNSFPLLTVNGPTTVKFFTGDKDSWKGSLSYENIYYYDTQIKDGKLALMDIPYKEVKFDKKENLLGGVAVDIYTNEIDGPPNYASENYVELSTPGLYLIDSAPLSLDHTMFFVLVKGNSGVNETKFIEPSEDISEVSEIKDEYTTNQSTLSFTGWTSFDNGHGIKYEIQNNLETQSCENIIDKSQYAIIFYNNGEVMDPEVHFLKSSELYSGQSESGVIYTQFDGNHILNKSIKTLIVKFEDEKDRKSFEEGIPMYEIPEEDNTKEILYRIDDQDTGKKWLKDNFNITSTGGSKK